MYSQFMMHGQKKHQVKEIFVCPWPSSDIQLRCTYRNERWVVVQFLKRVLRDRLESTIKHTGLEI